MTTPPWRYDYPLYPGAGKAAPVFRVHPDAWIVRRWLDDVDGIVGEVRDGRGVLLGTMTSNGKSNGKHSWIGFTLDAQEYAGTQREVAAQLYEHRAHQAATEDPGKVMHAWDAGRPRTSKTATARDAGKWGVGPSDHTSCHKQIEYRERPPEGYVPDPVDKSAAIMGTLIHDALTVARQEAYPWRMFGVKVLVPGLDVEGEADEFDPVTGRVTDYKTAGDYKWDRIGKLGPPDGEWKQVLDYALGLEDFGHTVTEVELLYANRASGLWESFKRPYSRDAALAGVLELHGIIDSLDAGHPLPRVRSGDELLGPTVNALCARYCPAVRHCWNLDEVPPERTPEGWLLVRDDVDGAVTATLTEYDDARAAAREGKKRQDYTRALLEGLEPGRYGDMTLNWSGGNLGSPRPDPVARVVQLETEMLTAAEQGRAPVDPVTLPYPETRKVSPVTIQVKPVRAAALEAEGGAA